MSETFAKRARAQNKKMKQKDKADSKKVRKEQPAPEPTPEALEALQAAYFYDPTDPLRRDERA
jgi:hypothetical protein